MPTDLGVGEAMKVVIDDMPLAVVRTGESEVRAIFNICSHEYFDLASECFVEGHHIECSLHGSMFDLSTGHPDALPATDPLPVYAAKLEDEVIYADVDCQLNKAPLPSSFVR
jgi:3-phenylpropionate/trans-cinnamate dioxygenase ferredoxin subunit